MVELREPSGAKALILFATLRGAEAPLLHVRARLRVRARLSGALEIAPFQNWVATAEAVP